MKSICLSLVCNKIYSISQLDKCSKCYLIFVFDEHDKLMKSFGIVYQILKKDTLMELKPLKFNGY